MPGNFDVATKWPRRYFDQVFSGYMLAEPDEKTSKTRTKKEWTRTRMRLRLRTWAR